METKANNEGPVIIKQQKQNIQTEKSSEDYLNEYDDYYFANEKYFNAGHGGKQRNKKEIELNNKRVDPSGNVRLCVTKLQNFEQNRRRKTSNSS
jgi:hypothetical protein